MFCLTINKFLLYLAPPSSGDVIHDSKVDSTPLSKQYLSFLFLWVISRIKDLILPSMLCTGSHKYHLLYFK